jgi:ribosomal-protein-serine acetyltransferase
MDIQLLPDELSSSRLVLRRHKLEHAPALFKCIDHDRERLREFLPWVDATRTVLDVAIYITITLDRWEKGEMFDYSVFSKEDESFVGVMDVHEISWTERRCEIGFWVLGEQEGKGYISEALSVLEQALFDVGFNRLEIRCSSLNTKSAKVPKRNGYVLEGTLRKHTLEQGKFRDTLILAKLAKTEK